VVDFTELSPIGEIRCPDPACRFVQRHVNIAVAALGLTTVNHRCEQSSCRKWMTILFRTSLGRTLSARVLGAVPRLGRDEEAMRRTYRQFPELAARDGDDVVEFFIATGLLLGWITRGDPAPAPVSRPPVNGSATRRRVRRPAGRGSP
jgi:hypothetical protein